MVRLLLALVLAGWAGAAVVSAPDAGAAPGQCVPSVVVFGSGGGWCDGPIQPDGRWLHCESVYVVGFGGTNCFMVRAVPVEVDPRGWTPA